MQNQQQLTQELNEIHQSNPQALSQTAQKNPLKSKKLKMGPNGRFQRSPGPLAQSQQYKAKQTETDRPIQEKE